MTRAEALSALGLKEGATRTDITREYKRLMLKVHPDHGGSEYLAAKLNQARELLIRKS
jgi:curved DNA-binding protein CbpA